MDIVQFLRGITAVPGTSGNETEVAHALKEAFLPYCDEAQVDAMGSMTAVQRGTGRGPKVMLCAHLDEVSLMTTSVEEDGSVRFISLGVAAQILPAQEVWLLTAEGKRFGVIGAKPPHLTAADQRKKAYTTDELYIDTGLAPEEVRRLVPPGTPVQLNGPTQELMGGHIAGKTMDDRACAAIMLECAMEMQGRLHDADIYYVCASREEIDSLGAQTSAHRIGPDMAIVLDVTHGEMEGCAPGQTCPIDATPLAVGPNLHEKLTGLLREEAKRLRMKVIDEVCPGNTYTDAWVIQIACEGVPCALMSLPLKYMHTTVELCDMEVIHAQAHLLAQTLCRIRAGWEETLCY
ncbi:MAG: M42 family peptidase [Clostridia bacterium]|nr:M42 family peptidase [Clostridia bacterium]